MSILRYYLRNSRLLKTSGNIVELPNNSIHIQTYEYTYGSRRIDKLYISGISIYRVRQHGNESIICNQF